MNVQTFKNYSIVVLSASLGITTAAISAVSHAFTSMLTLVLDQATHQLKEEESMLSMDDLSKMSPYKLFMFIVDIVRPSKSVEDIPPDTAKDSDVSEEEMSALTSQDQAIDQHGAAEEGESEEHLSDADDEGLSIEPKEEVISSEKLGVENASKTTPSRMDGHNA